MRQRSPPEEEVVEGNHNKKETHTHTHHHPPCFSVFIPSLALSSLPPLGPLHVSVSVVTSIRHFSLCRSSSPKTVFSHPCHSSFSVLHPPPGATLSLHHPFILSSHTPPPQPPAPLPPSPHRLLWSRWTM